MKRIVAVGAVLGIVLLMLSGCATVMPVGAIYTELNLPVAATSNGGQYAKSGSSECMSVLALVAIGDASIDAAKKNGNITKVYHVDWSVKNILGVLGKYKVTVYGE